MKIPTAPRIMLVSFLALGLASTLGVPSARPSSAEWGYTARQGLIPPIDWGDVSATCRTGESQSPIALGTLDALPGAGLSAPVLHYGIADLVVFNNGHAIEAEVEEGAGAIDIDGTVYELLQFHVHRASEHMIDGERSPAEIHLVHRAANGDLAVLGFLVEEGERSARLNPFFRAAGRLPDAGDERHVAAFDLSRLVPREAVGFYHYSGSLTTPPCSEGVSWWVWDTPASADAEQLARLLEGLPETGFPEGNRRPVQSRNGRAVHHVEGT